MSKQYSETNNRLNPKGTFAKALTIVYLLAVWLTTSIIVGIYSHGKHHVSGAIALGVATALIGLIPVLLAYAHNGVYVIELSKKRDQALRAKLDERQRESRRYVIERSYGLLAALATFAAFSGSGWFGNNMSQQGVLLLGLNALVFVLGLPSLVAVWDKSVLTQSTSGNTVAGENI